MGAADQPARQAGQGFVVCIRQQYERPQPDERTVNKRAKDRPPLQLNTSLRAPGFNADEARRNVALFSAILRVNIIGVGTSLDRIEVTDELSCLT
jgi:hypothetical protein